MSEKKIENTETVVVEETETPVRWYKNPKNVALAVTSTIAGTAVVVWLRNRLNEDETFDPIDISFNDSNDS